MDLKTFGGRKIIIRKLSRADLRKVRRFQNFINSLVAEDAFILMNQRVSLKREKKWMQNNLEKIKARQEVFLVAEAEQKVIGLVQIGLGLGRQEHVGTLAISIRQGYRGIKLGSYLMKRIIELARKELKPRPKVLRLTVFPQNEPAIRLYRKCGFKKAAVIPKQQMFKGKLLSEIVMLKYL